MTDREFALTILDLMPQDDDWRGFVSNLHAKVSDSEENGLPIRSATYITAIRDEYWFWHKDDHNANSRVFSTQLEAQKRSTAAKQARPADIIATSSAPSSSKRARNANPNRAHLQCANPNCTSKTGHDTSGCIAYKGSKEGQYGDWWKGLWNIHLPESQRTKENNVPPKSHPAYSCLHGPSINQSSAVDTSLERSSTTTIMSSDNLSQANSALATDFYAWGTEACDTIAQTTLPVLNPHIPLDNSCHHDSGANWHVFHDRSAFEEYQPISPVTVKGFGHNLSTVAIRKGNVHLEGNYNGNKSSILLTNVLHIPAAHTNLISGVQLGKAGVTSTLGRNSIFLSMHNKIIVSGSVINDMYRLDLKIVPPTSISLASHIAPASLTSCIGPRERQSDFYTTSWGT